MYILAGGLITVHAKVGRVDALGVHQQIAHPGAVVALQLEDWAVLLVGPRSARSKEALDHGEVAVL
jgi:hypothetical protein